MDSANVPQIYYGVIYKITNLVNKKIYIGQTTQSIIKRWKNHVRSKKGNMPIACAIKKYGSINFIIEAIDFAPSMEILNEKEKFWIKQYNCLANTSKGYNICSGGSFGNSFAGKTKEEMEVIKQKIGNRPYYSRKGIKASKEAIEKRKITLLAKTKEDKKKIHEKCIATLQNKSKEEKEIEHNNRSLAQRGKVGNKNSFYGKQHTDITKQRISQTKKQNKDSVGENNSRAIKVVCLETKQIFLYMKKGAEIIYGHRKFLFLIRDSISLHKAIRGFTWIKFEDLLEDANNYTLVLTNVLCM